MIGSIGLLVGGLIILTVSADRLVVAAARVSRRSGISSLLIGAIVIGLGTSIPEFVVSLIAADPDEALGNVVGSNISNLTLVLGTAAMVVPISTRLRMIKREGVLMFASMVLLTTFIVDGDIERWEGIVLLAGMLVAGFVLVWWSGRAPGGVQLDEEVERFTSSSFSALTAEAAVGILALVATVIGARLLVQGAEGMADELDLSGAFVGLVILAVGTSLPELATSVAAVRRSEPDLAVGNVLGSNLFNSLAVAGSVGIAQPGQLSDGFSEVAILMAIVGAVGGAFALTNRRIERSEGVLLLFGFAFLIIMAP